MPRDRLKYPGDGYWVFSNKNLPNCLCNEYYYDWCPDDPVDKETTFEKYIRELYNQRNFIELSFYNELTKRW